MFNFFKKKSFPNKNTTDKQLVKLSDFKPYYLYGLTRSFEKKDKEKFNFNNLYQIVIGNIGGLIIPNAFHPYKIVNKKGLTVWNAAYLKVHFSDQKENIFNEIIKENAVFIIDTSSEFSIINDWPDKRLNQSDLFKEKAPFIIPFLIYGSQDPKLNKLSESQELNDIAPIIKNIWNPEMEVLGFDQFDEKYPSLLIDNFLNKI
jgi:hypothetical protein